MPAVLSMPSGADRLALAAAGRREGSAAGDVSVGKPLETGAFLSAFCDFMRPCHQQAQRC